MKRRVPRKKIQKIREIFWPSMGWSKLLRYYKHRIGRLPGTPYYIAAGFAAGVSVSFTPFVGFHLVMAGIIAWIMGGSLMAMVLGAVISGNPWTYPFIWVGTYKLGELMMGGHETRAASSALTRHLTFSDLLQKPLELLLPMTLGSIPLVILSWIISFYFVRHIVTRYKKERLSRIRKY